jgi:hypothetical protein
MTNNSGWQNRLGTVRAVALVVLVVLICVVWFIRH